MPLPGEARVHIRPAVLGALALLALTAVHHVYGAQRFGTPWRAHMAPIAGGIALVILAGVTFNRWAGSSAVRHAARWISALVILAFPVAFIGFFEGGYNHVLKDALYWISGPTSMFNQLFPSPRYERPVDALFEITGILQFPLAVWVALKTVLLIRAPGSRAAVWRAPGDRPLRSG